MNKNNIKIALIGDSLAGGGAEKVQALLSNYFHNNGFEVHNCIFIDWISYKFSGNLVNLGKIESKIPKFLLRFKKLVTFYQFIKNNKFDYIIDFRMRDNHFRELILSTFVYPRNTIYTVHSGVLDFYFPKNFIFSRLLYRNKRIVSVSKAITKKIIEKKLVKSCETIYNPIDLSAIAIDLQGSCAVNFKYILAVGRFNTNVKQIDKLIDVYSKSDLPNNRIKLLLVGDGVLKTAYQKLVAERNLTNEIIFIDFQINPFPIYKQALFTVLCSRNEGLPNVLIESLACETPVVAFDCFSGPSEIIRNGINGILVENQNFDALRIAVDKMVNSQDLYMNCKQNAKASIARFELENIGKNWKQYLFSLK